MQQLTTTLIMLFLQTMWKCKITLKYPQATCGLKKSKFSET